MQPRASRIADQPCSWRIGDDVGDDQTWTQAVEIKIEPIFDDEGRVRSTLH